ncbi:hypothetical protein B0T17DRAFT_121525 [Bombardia bombarda]|uniref:Uncharacterized protein n=1 Tax=Bombardia bombarda TaxID=252184 RepID=A0AA39U1U6_9PEZI|nr:hypothetical protein B0T17DRAFT_121525 [Bombardia bombarda]
MLYRTFQLYPNRGLPSCLGTLTIPGEENIYFLFLLGFYIRWVSHCRPMDPQAAFFRSLGGPRAALQVSQVSQIWPAYLKYLTYLNFFLSTFNPQKSSGPVRAFFGSQNFIRYLSDLSLTELKGAVAKIPDSGVNNLVMQPGACMPSCPQTTLFLCQLCRYNSAWMELSLSECLCVEITGLAALKSLSHSDDIAGIDNKSKAIFDKRGNCCCLWNHQLSISSSGKTRSWKS